MDRFDLEDRITQHQATYEEALDTLMYMIGDSKDDVSEDDLLNVVIGVKAHQKYSYERLWSTFEQLIKDKKIV